MQPVEQIVLGKRHKAGYNFNDKIESQLDKICMCNNFIQIQNEKNSRT